jgi:integrase
VASIERRLGKDGKVSYRAKVRLRGEKARTRTFKRKTDAEAWAKAAETDLSRGLYVPSGPDRKRTVGDLIDRTVKDHLPTKRNNKSAHKVEGYLAWWKSELGELTLDKLTPQRISERRAKLLARKPKRGERMSPATANRYLAGLSVATKYGWKELGWLPRNPVLDVSKGAENAGVVRFLSDDERDRLLEAARLDPDSNIHTAIVLALSTGLRASSLRALTWDDVDFDRDALRVAESKNGEGRWVPLIGPAVRELKQHKERDPLEGEGFVFKSSNKDVPAEINGPAWMRVKRAASLTGTMNFRFHDLRHTAGTYLNEAGASAIQIAAALGHKTLAMAKRYSHQSPEFTRSVFDKLTSRIAARSEERPKKPIVEKDST